MCIQCVYMVCIQCVYGLYTVCVQCVYRVCVHFVYRVQCIVFTDCDIVTFVLYVLQLF